MPKFCPDCGVRLQVPVAKFCPECGFNLQTSRAQSDIPLPETSKPIHIPPSEQTEPPQPGLPPFEVPRFKKYDLGVKLEEVVEQIFQAEGYQTKRRERVKGKGNYFNEIDILAQRGDERVAIECKNYSKPVGIEIVRDFAKKLDDLGTGWRGIIIGYSDLTEDASNYAQTWNIEILDHDNIKEKWFSISVGRISLKGDVLYLEDALPLNFDYTRATALDLKNLDHVQVKDAKLTYHPYAKYDYQFSADWTDPTREHHKYRDKGSIIVDMLDGEVLNPKITSSVGKVTKVVKLIVSSEAREENRKVKKIVQEIIENKPASKYSLAIAQDYKAIKIPPEISPSEAKSAAIDYILAKNTHTVTYATGRKDEIPDINFRDFIPKRSHIRKIDGDIVFFPKWTIHFIANDVIYTREALGFSGTLFEDTIRYCPSHPGISLLSSRKKNIAVCEVCGHAYCEEHIKQCPICKKWLCIKHGIVCSSCSNQYCTDHISTECSNCGHSLCTACTVTCPVCNTKYGRNHTQVCDKCGTKVCQKCISITGLLRKTRICKNCL